MRLVIPTLLSNLLVISTVLRLNASPLSVLFELSLFVPCSVIIGLLSGAGAAHTASSAAHSPCKSLRVQQVSAGSSLLLPNTVTSLYVDSVRLVFLLIEMNCPQNGEKTCSVRFVTCLPLFLA